MCLTSSYFNSAITETAEIVGSYMVHYMKSPSAVAGERNVKGRSWCELLMQCCLAVALFPPKLLQDVGFMMQENEYRKDALLLSSSKSWICILPLKKNQIPVSVLLSLIVTKQSGCSLHSSSEGHQSK